MQKFRWVDRDRQKMSLCKASWKEFFIWKHWFLDFIVGMDRLKLLTRWSTILNRMPFLQYESDSPFPSYEGFSLLSIGFSQKPIWTPPRTIFSLLARISFYVSSRRVRICVHIERNPEISLSEACHEDIFTVQAMSDLFFWFEEIDWSILSLESIDCSWRRGNRPYFICGHASRRYIPFTNWNNSSLEKNGKNYNRDSPDHGQVFSRPRYTSNISWKHRTRYRCPQRESPYRSLSRSWTVRVITSLLYKVHVNPKSGSLGTPISLNLILGEG